MRTHRQRAGWLLAAAVMVAAACAGGSADATPRGKIRIKGSDTMLLLVQRWAEAFMATHPGVAVEVEGGSTTKGLRALIDGVVEIASASRPLRPEEAKQLAERWGTLGYSVLAARDALSVYVHPDNPATDLDLEQLRGIFTGEIRNWRAVGGKTAEITVIARNPASGTRLFFAEHVLGGEPYTRRARVLNTTTRVVEAVRNDANAIGYGGFGHAEGVRRCNVGGVAPSTANVHDGSYPIARYLYLYTAEPPAGLVKKFVAWVLGDEGQRVVTESGYVPLR